MKLGYLLAGIVLGLSVLFIGISIIVLEFQKPRVTAEFFNRDFAQLQEKIIAQADTVQRVFGLDESLPALGNLRSRQWNSKLVSPSSSARLEAEHRAALADVESLRQAVVSQLETDVSFITDQLAAKQKAALKESVVAPPAPIVPSLPGDGKSVQEIYARTGSSPFLLRAALCDNALDLVKELQAEARSADNKAALSRAGGQIEKFLQIIRNQEDLSEQAEAAPVPAPSAPSFTEPAAIERPSRKDNVREDLFEMLSSVQKAVTDGWNLERTVESLEEKLRGFTEQADKIGERSANLLNGQLALLGGLLLVAVLAFFIAVGSDLVKAILDSAVWLSHIYNNTANGDYPRDDHGPGQ